MPQKMSNRKDRRGVQLTLWGPRKTRARFQVDERHAGEMRKNLEKLGEHQKMGEAIPSELRTWVGRQSKRHQNTMVKHGFIDKSMLAAQMPLMEIVDSVITELRRKGKDERYIQQIRSHCQLIFDACGAVFPKDIAKVKIDEVLEGLAKKRGWSVRTRNAHLVSLQTVFNKGKDALGLNIANPTERVEHWTESGNRAAVRRALGIGEIQRLIMAAWLSVIILYGMSGPARAVLYIVAVTTGWRWGELRKLRRSDFFLDDEIPMLAPPAGTQKSRRPDAIPLRSDVVVLLRWFFAGRSASDNSPAFPMPISNAGAKLMRHDLAATGDSPETAAEKAARGEAVNPAVPYEDAHGRVADFHALRHAFATLLDRLPKQDPRFNSRVMPEILMRHAVTGLTKKVYTQSERQEQLDALEALPAVFSLADFGLAAQPSASTADPLPAAMAGTDFGGSFGGTTAAQHRTSSDSLAGEDRQQSAASASAEVTQPHEKTPTSEEAGVSRNWHPLGDSNPCSQTENLTIGSRANVAYPHKYQGDNAVAAAWPKNESGAFRAINDSAPFTPENLAHMWGSLPVATRRRIMALIGNVHETGEAGSSTTLDQTSEVDSDFGLVMFFPLAAS